MKEIGTPLGDWMPLLKGTFSDPVISEYDYQLSRIVRISNNLTHLHCYVEISSNNLTELGNGSVYIDLPVLANFDSIQNLKFPSSGVSFLNNNFLVADKIKIVEQQLIFCNSAGNELDWSSLSVNTQQIIAVNIYILT